MDTTNSTIRESQKDNKKKIYIFEKRRRSIESEVVVDDDFRSTVTAVKIEVSWFSSKSLSTIHEESNTRLIYNFNSFLFSVYSPFPFC